MSCSLIILGLLVLVYFFFERFTLHRKVDSNITYIFLAGLVLITLGFLDPKKFKIGDLELEQFEKIRDETIRAQQSADKNVKIAAEFAAMNLWNAGRFGNVKNEEKAISILKNVYGNEEANEILIKLQKSGYLIIPKEDLDKLPTDDKLNKDIVPLMLDFKNF